MTSHLVPGRVVVRLLRHGSVVVHRRSLVTAAILTLASLALGAAALATGEYPLTVAQAYDVLTGGGTDMARFIVIDQRLARAVTAAAVGAALGLSGAVFQTLSDNPLGSPDILGFTTGAATGGLVVILLATSPSASVIALGTLVGGLGVALVVQALAGRTGTTDRLIVCGIAVSALLAAVNDYLISRAALEQAEAAKAWRHGSLALVTWSSVAPLAVALAILVPALLLSSRTLRTLELGHDAAALLGANPASHRRLLLVLAVLAAGAAVATAGPISYVALAAPQLARRLSRSPGVTLLATMCTGAFLLQAADLAAQRALSPFQIPTGLVSAAFGGAYLLWLLTADRSRH